MFKGEVTKEATKMGRVIVILITVGAMASILNACAEPAVAPAPELTPEPAPAVKPTPGTPSAPDIAPSTTPTPEPERTPECEHPYPTVLMNQELKSLIDQGLMDPCLSLNSFYGEDEDLATKADGTPYNFALSYLSGPGTGGSMQASHEWLSNICGITESLIHRCGGETIDFGDIDQPPRNPGTDPILQNIEDQIYFVEELISVIKPDALLILAFNGEMLAPVVEQAANAGIAIFTVDRAISAPSISSYVYHDFDGEFGSNLLGQYFVQLADRTGQEYHILELVGFPGSVLDQERHDGFHVGLAGDPRIQVIESGYTGYKDNNMQEAVVEYFNANPELNGVYVHAGGTVGVIQGLDEIGRLRPTGHPEHVVFTTNDSVSYTFDYVDKGFVDAFVTGGFWDLADIAVKNSFHVVVLGQPVMKDISVPMDIVTIDNINSLTQFGCTPIYLKIPGPPGNEWAIWPVLDTSEIGVDTPTKAMRMELMGY